MAVLTTLELEYVVRGYHEYKRVWTPVLDEMLSTEIERGNPHDEYAVAVMSWIASCWSSLGRFSSLSFAASA